MKPRKYDYEKILTVGMPMVYEVAAKQPQTVNTTFGMPRWNYKNQTIGWFDQGYTKIMYEAEILSLQAGLMTLVLTQAFYDGGRQPRYIVPIDRDADVRSGIYNPHQWEWDGFFQPDGGWEQYAPIVPKCECGAEAYARLTNTPVGMHSDFCKLYTRNPYR
jgi:hypothetical protein